MSKTAGIVSGAVGATAAAATVAAIVAQRYAIGRARRGVDLSAKQFGELPYDRSGTITTEDGVELYYEEVGPVDAPLTLVFVHGFCLNLGAFHFQRIALREQFGARIRMVFFDLRSHGRSASSDPKRCSMEQLGEDLMQILNERVPNGPVFFIGHSMGGMALLALADAHPEFLQSRRVLGVALMSTSTGKLAAVTLGLPALIAKLRGPLMPILLRGAKRRADLVERTRKLGTDIAWSFTRRLAFADKDVDLASLEYLTNMIAATRVEVIADFYPELMRHDKLAALPALKGTRTLVLCGDSDLLTPVEHSKEIAEALPDCELVVVPKSGHLVILEHPEAVNEPLGKLVGEALKQANKRAR